MRLLPLLLILILTLPLTIAATREGKITLLTVTNQEGTQGGTADLQLIIKPGTGSIFFDSLPLTKLDTQISTRYANQIACDYIEMDCSKYDFFYRIRADSGIVGGPSAGAAMTVLTIAVLTDTELDERTVITGTINSGGLIGPVAGISAKALAAQKEGFDKVLVPKFEIPVNNSNETVFDIELVRIGSLDEALYHFTGKDWNHVDTELSPPEEYQIRMAYVAEQLCEKRDQLRSLLEEEQIPFNDSNNFSGRAQLAEEEGRSYARASICFSENLQLRSAEFGKISAAGLLKALLETRSEIEEMDQALDERELRTISDLETYIIVKERLRDAHESITFDEDENVTSDRVAYAVERLASAKTWSVFFGMEGKEYQFDQDYLQEACRNKIAEAEERINYVRLYVPNYLGNARETLEGAYLDIQQQNFATCLFRASKAKAEANTIGSVIGLGREQVSDVVEEKLLAVEKQLARQQSQQLFPILGYSYWEYADALLQFDDTSALTFVEYALEMGNMAIYFKPAKQFEITIDWRSVTLYVMGLLSGLLIMAPFLLKKGKVRTKRAKAKGRKPRRPHS